MATIHNLLELSPRHVPRHLADTLADLPGLDAAYTAFGILITVPDQVCAGHTASACTVMGSTAVGCLAGGCTVAASTAVASTVRSGAAADCTAQPLPDEVLAVLRYARDLDCAYILFDPDAEVDDDLPTWH